RQLAGPPARHQQRRPQAPRLRCRAHRRDQARLPHAVRGRPAAGRGARAAGRAGRIQRRRAPAAGLHRRRRAPAAALMHGASVHAPGLRGGNPPRILLVAGEASGDGLGAGLVEALRQRYPDALFAGVGGDAMRNAGVETWHDASELAVMGLAEVLRHLPRLLRLRRELRERALAWRPDVVIGIDAPDFNLAVERWFRERGIPTVHYVSPSVWAWREKRA